jgi:hypothetical protein
MALLLAAVAEAGAQGVERAATACTAWRECQAQALDAEARGDFETFHDLAWRTMQRRGAQDPEVMRLLARAQAVSGRPHDALVMLRRIAEGGTSPAEALTDERFTRTRALPEWARVEALIAAIPAPPAMPLPEPTPPSTPTAKIAVPPAAAAAAGTPPQATFTPEVLLRLGRRNIVPGGVAHDSASGRVLVGNRFGRSVITISERLQTSMDLTRAASAGFHEVLAIAIDARRGDLWVASASTNSEGGTRQAAGAEPTAALHKLQLVSGRPLATIAVETGGRQARITGLAVTPGGAVLMLDGEEGRLWSLPANGRTVTLAATLALRNPAGLAIDERGQHAFVAHDEGVSRLVLATGAVHPVAAPEGVSVLGAESLEWHGGSLVALQRASDGTRQLVRWRLNRRQTAISGVDILDPLVETCQGGSAAAISKKDVYYLAAEAGAGTNDQCALVVRRLRLP